MELIELTKKLSKEKGLESKGIEINGGSEISSFYNSKQVFSPEYTVVKDYIKSLKCSCSCRCHGKC